MWCERCEEEIPEHGFKSNHVKWNLAGKIHYFHKYCNPLTIEEYNAMKEQKKFSKLKYGQKVIKYPTCFDCKNALKSMGFPGDRIDPPEPPEAECQVLNSDGYDRINQMADENNIFHEEFFPIHCKQFDPELIDKCDNCDKEMNVPKWDHDLTAHGVMDDCYVCSDKCKHQLEAKVKLEIKRMQL